MSTPEQCDRFPTGFIRHCGVPDLGGPSTVEAGAYAGYDSFAGSAEEVALELDGSEIVRAFGKVGEGAVAAGGIGEGDDGRRMQIAVGGEQFRTQGKATGESSMLIAGEFDADQTREGSSAACVKFVDGGHGEGKRGLEIRD